MIRAQTIEQLDIDFNHFIKPPSRTFADTIRLFYGWSRPNSEMLDRAPYIADTDGVEEHIEAMQRFASATYNELCIGSGVLKFEVEPELVKEFVKEYENQIRFGVYGFDEEVAWLANRYLQGEGDDQKRFEVIRSWV